MLILSREVVKNLRAGLQTAVLKDSNSCRWAVGATHRVYHRAPMGTAADPVIELLVTGFERVPLEDVDNHIALRLGFDDLAEFQSNWKTTHRNTWYADNRVWIIDVEIPNGKGKNERK